MTHVKQRTFTQENYRTFCIVLYTGIGHVFKYADECTTQISGKYFRMSSQSHRDIGLQFCPASSSSAFVNSTLESSPNFFI